MLDEEDQIERDSYDSEDTAKRLVPWQAFEDTSTLTAWRDCHVKNPNHPVSTRLAKVALCLHR